MEEEKNKQVQLSVPEKLFNALFAIVAIVLFIITRVVLNFGGGSSAFYGIMSMLIYAVSFFGVVFVYIRTQKPTPEWWLNVITLALALAFL